MITCFQRSQETYIALWQNIAASNPPYVTIAGVAMVVAWACTFERLLILCTSATIRTPICLARIEHCNTGTQERYDCNTGTQEWHECNTGTQEWYDYNTGTQEWYDIITYTLTRSNIKRYILLLCKNDWSTYYTNNNRQKRTTGGIADSKRNTFKYFLIDMYVNIRY